MTTTEKFYFSHNILIIRVIRDEIIRCKICVYSGIYVITEKYAEF